MKAITLSDDSPKNPVPWLSLVEWGIKKIETRSWSTSYRGDLLLCAAANSRTPNRGLAVCVVTVVDCVPMTAAHEQDACIASAPGRWAWMIESVRWLSTKFPVKGSQGFFSVGIPEDITLHELDKLPQIYMEDLPEYLQDFLRRQVNE